MRPLEQERFEQEVLFSLMKDSVNVLLRTEIRPRGLLVADSVDWTNRLVLDYLPELARAIPLAEASIVAPREGDEVDFWLSLPQPRVRDALTAFLPRFLEAAIELGAVEPATKDAVDGSLVKVAEEVAAAWQLLGF